MNTKETDRLPMKGPAVRFTVSNHTLVWNPKTRIVSDQLGHHVATYFFPYAWSTVKRELRQALKYKPVTHN